MARGGDPRDEARAGRVCGGGWFIPGGHVEQGERLHESAAREVFEETGISIDPGGLRLVDVMTYETGRGTAHTVIYNGECPAGAEPVINDEHLVWRWMTPEAYVARFLESGMLRGRGCPRTRWCWRRRWRGWCGRRRRRGRDSGVFGVRRVHGLERRSGARPPRVCTRARL
ncbi:MAG: NUDIX domain-containing protein [Dehalococcoidia bacterium]|nr:NUDIX domain-containing protein [Dehalococcoidia bacterium]